MRLTIDVAEEEQSLLRTHLDGPKWAAAVFDFDNYLRGQHKYGDDEEAANIRTVLHEMLKDRGLNLYEP